MDILEEWDPHAGQQGLIFETWYYHTEATGDWGNRAVFEQIGEKRRDVALNHPTEGFEKTVEMGAENSHKRGL